MQTLGTEAVKKGLNIVPASLAPRALLAATRAETPVLRLHRSKDAETSRAMQGRTGRGWGGH